MQIEDVKAKLPCKMSCQFQLENLKMKLLCFCARHPPKIHYPTLLHPTLHYSALPYDYSSHFFCTLLCAALLFSALLVSILLFSFLAYSTLLFLSVPRVLFSILLCFSLLASADVSVLKMNGQWSEILAMRAYNMETSTVRQIQHTPKKVAQFK